MDLWHISEERFDPNLKKIHSQETVYTIGNGYFCTRGTCEEDYPRATPATLLFGVFDEIPIAKEELANTPDWVLIQLFVNGERFRLDKGTILGYHRTLDLYNGILRRTVHWESPKGVRLHITSERFASLADEHVGAIRYSVLLEEGADQHANIALWSSFNTAEGNYNVLHWETVNQGHNDDILWLQSETKKTLVELAQTMSFTTETPGFRKEIIDSDIAPSIRFYGTLAPGTMLTAEKIVVMYTSRDGTEPVSKAIEHHLKLMLSQDPSLARGRDDTNLLLTRLNVYEKLLMEHQEAWQSFWQQADIILEGDTLAQLSLRYNLYQLRINVSPHDSRYSIAAKGLTGFGYRGHVFHDTEIFMLPFFTYVMPEIARNLLLYRYHLLPAARKKAANNGYEGAQYPWESTLDGEEATPGSIIHPETSEIIPVLNGFIELHITASIAHAVWEYWHVTGDDEFMRNYGAEIILSTAMFWSSRTEKDEERGDYEITDVIGPDEWHEHVNNNSYTNFMARDNIQNALRALEWLKTTAPEKMQALQQKIGLTSQDLEHWHDVVNHIRILQDPDTGLIEQFEGFFKLQTLDQEKYKGRKDSYQGILGMEEVQKYRIIKQADVLMLLTVLNQKFDLKTKKVNWDYYYPITDHDYGSSLTPAFHVILASELGLIDDAYELFMKGALVDLENLRGNTPEGIHTACCGAVWQAAILGIAGLRVTDHGYTTHPCWPDNWTRLAFKFKCQGEQVSIDLRK